VAGEGGGMAEEALPCTLLTAAAGERGKLGRGCEGAFAPPALADAEQGWPTIRSPKTLPTLVVVPPGFGHMYGYHGTYTM